MSGAQTPIGMSPKLLKVMERARAHPEEAFNSLAHLIDESALAHVFSRVRKDAAAGVDGVTKEKYERNLERNLRDLHERLKSTQYRHQLIRRVQIPKGGGKTRPIGISAFEDKLVQGAVRDVMEAIYEQDFLDCSSGFRPGRSAHDAILAINQTVRQGKTSWILEADIASFFDSINRKMLMEMIRKRVVDGSLLRLIGKCLRAGVLEGSERSNPVTGTAQGSALSPLLGNIYLHRVLDFWFEQEIRPRLRGNVWLVRYADDFVICFEREDDARRVMAVLPKRMERFELSLHPDKTRLIPFRRPPREQSGGKGPGTFDFLGFTFFWGRGRGNRWVMLCKTQSARYRRAVVAVHEWCRRYRHLPVAIQHLALGRRVQGYLNYFGVSGNSRSLSHYVQRVEEAWFKWLRRRSQRTRLTWERFAELKRRFPLPRPRIVVRFWGRVHETSQRRSRMVEIS